MPDSAHDHLVAALRESWQACEPAREVRPGVFAGGNLPERISAALTDLAAELGSTEALVAHRPGCWEAEHVRRLGYLYVEADA